TITTQNNPLGTDGVHKYTFDGMNWNDQGFNTTIGAGTPGNPGDLFDVDAKVDLSGNVTLYVAQGSNLYRIDDTLASTGATWTGATATVIATVPASARYRSVAIVRPAPGAQSFNINTSTTGTGSGTVAKSPPTGPYAKCSTVSLTATPAGGSIFDQ